jgi:DNA mismatch repair protein MutL
MNRIQRLPAAVVARIAAGEMIQRPVSALKELVENSLDAQSSSIHVRIRGRLDAHLEVADDGIGIAREDLPLALERHATSKIRDAGDLEAVTTLGFRGEALPSIAQVSRLVITSRVRESEAAWRLRAEGGRVEAPEPASRAPGTTVVVEDLFFNTPVRKRALASPASELRLARHLISAYALVALAVRWSLEVDERSWLELAPASDVRGRLAEIFGGELAGEVVDFSYRGGEDGELRIQGFLGPPERARASAQQQMHFVNGRPVVVVRLIQALRQAYGDLLAPGQHPWAILFLELPPGWVDVNVHPTKREVRFRDEDLVFREVLQAVRAAVRAFRPDLRGFVSPPESRGRVAEAAAPGSRRPEGERRLPDGEEVARLLYESERPPEVGPEPWQLGGRYIVVPREDALLVVDQHAAHERILYEAALGRWREGKVASQALLFPEVLEVGEAAVEVFQQVAEAVRALGFDAEVFGPGALVVRAVPVLLDEPLRVQVLAEILQEVCDAEARPGEALERFAKAFACRAAVRSGQRLTRSEMRSLLEQLDAAGTPHGDPHGRPALILLRAEDLDRRFQRR